MIVSTTSAGWLKVNTTSGSTPLAISVSVDPTGLTASPSYQGFITVTPTGGSAIRIQVNLSVTAATAVSAPATPLTFTYIAGAADPPAQTVQVTGTGQNLTFSATVTSGSDWLSVSPATGTAPQAVTVSVNPGSLAANQTTPEPS